MPRSQTKDQRFAKLWNRIDIDGNGHLDRAEFNLFMETYYASVGWTVSESAQSQAFNLLDKNKDGRIDQNELSHYINTLFSGVLDHQLYLLLNYIN